MTKASDLRVQLSLQRADFSVEVDLALPGHGITVLFGPSGSGKTSLLRCIAGLEKAHGYLYIGNQTWQDSAKKIFKPTWQRDIGYVFQEASLFEHLNVRQNLNFALCRTGQSHGSHDLAAALDLLGIRHLLERAVLSLSGGERQRVAIARALATHPRLLLLDEPLASLDLARRHEVLPWLERLRRELRTPMFYVTHSMDELARLADHVVMLDHGRVRANGPLAQAMVSPAVAIAIGDEAGLVTTGEVVERSNQDQLALVQFGGGALWVRDPGIEPGQKVRVRILARDVSLALSVHEDSTIQNRLQGVIDSITDDAHPSQAIVRVRCGTELVLGRVTQRSLRHLRLEPGASVWCQVKSVALII